jgi:multidrug resistance efflux pump
MPVNRIMKHTPTNGRSRRRTMLVPVAYSESVMPALRLARSSRIARQIAKWLFTGLLATTGLMAVAPWQQSIRGTGNVLAYAPDQRPQVIQAPIKGRIVRWGEGIVENAEVTKGQFIAEIRDLDESYTARLEQQLQNSEQSVQAARQQLEANQRVLEADRTIVDTFKRQVRAFEQVKEDVIAAQNAFIEMAQKKVIAEQQQLAEYQAAIPQLEAEYERMARLHAEDNISLQRLQEVQRELSEAKAKVSRSEAYVAAAQSDLTGKQSERSAKIQRAQVEIDYAQAALRKRIGDVSKAESDVAKSEQELNKAETEVLDMQVQLSRQQSQILTAPLDGYVVQITPNMGTAILKEGDPVCTLVPKTTDRSVQIWLDGNDAPLVEPGRHVRLQFEGWPAIQFSGWPSVAVGTFGGEVISVDATDDGMGKFRVLIMPDETDQPWPQERFLRQGVRANAWVLLDQVPLWFEVWRQLNGFPPVVDVESSKDKDQQTKRPKLP